MSMNSFVDSFEFADHSETETPSDGFILRVPSGVVLKADLMNAYSEAGRFPSYFGENWDALLDCLRDFEWIEDKKIVIEHEDLPLSAHPVECRIYLQILHEAIAEWLRGPLHASDPNHELRVRFPAEVRSSIEALMS